MTTTERADTDLRPRAEEVLRGLAGPAARLRDDQWTAIHALVVQRRRALVVQRTGWGKSAVYFVATALLRAAGAGPTVIVSPLLALMRNQIDAAARAGVQAVTVNSANTDDWEATYAAIDAGEVDVLLVSPERLNNPDFRDRVLPRLTASAGLLVVDEAHCVSDWGHDFRPDYRRLRALIAELPPGIPVLATTATANDRVVRDVTEQLGLASGRAARAARLAGPREPAAVGRAAADARAAARAGSPRTWRSCRAPGSSTRSPIAAAEEVAEFLRERGFPVASYTGKTDPEQRLAAEADLLANRVKALVATSALGMGFDKPDLGFVVHLGAPSSPVAYYQQIGRAGRAVERAEVVLLPGAEDRDIWAYFASLAFPPEPLVRRTLEVLSDRAAVDRRDRDPGRPVAHPPGDAAEGPRQRRRGATGEGRLGRDRASRGSTTRERHRRIATAREAEQGAMLAYLDTPECRLVYLRRQLDDDTEQPCGRCDTCTGTVWSPVGRRRRRGRGAASGSAGPGWRVPPRKQWPSGMAELGVPVSGRIPAGELADEGRVIGRLSDIGWGTRLRELVSGDDVPVPPDVLDACVTVLAGWAWAARPVGVVGVGSRTRPHQLAHLARRISEIGRLPLLGTAAPRRPAPGAVGELRAAAGGGVGRVHRARPRRSRRPGAAGRRRGRQRLDGHGASPACCAGPGRSAVLPFALALDA